VRQGVAAFLSKLIVAQKEKEVTDYYWAKAAYAGRKSFRLPTLTVLDLKLRTVLGSRSFSAFAVTPKRTGCRLVILTFSNQEQEIAMSMILASTVIFATN
jgi:hypothetical protein